MEASCPLTPWSKEDAAESLFTLAFEDVLTWGVPRPLSLAERLLGVAIAFPEGRLRMCAVPDQQASSESLA